MMLGVPASTVKEMDNAELLDWVEYLERRPFGWREDNRTAMIARALGVDKSPGDLFSSLSVLQQENRSDDKRAKNKLLAFAARSRGNQWGLLDGSQNPT